MPSFEQNPNGYSAEQIAEFEKSRLDENKAHDEVNMLSSYFKDDEKPTKGDYDEALHQLELLEETVNEESVPEAVDKALRIFFAGGGVLVQKGPKLLLAAALNILPYPKSFKEKTRENLGGGVFEQLQNTKRDYKEMRVLFQTAREELEQWKSDAEDLAKKQTGRS